MKKSLRIRFALLSAFAIAFAQIAVAAQTWPLEAALHQRSAVAAPSSAVDVPEHCGGLRVDADGAPVPQTAASSNFCEVRCQDAQQPDATDVVAAPVAEAWLLVPLAAAPVVRAATDAPLDAKCASPPARLLFARFLI